MPSLKFHEFCVNVEVTFFINYIDGCKNLFVWKSICCDIQHTQRLSKIAWLKIQLFY